MWPILIFAYVITIIVFTLTVYQISMPYNVKYRITDCSNNYNVPSIINDQWNWNMSQSDWFRDQELYSTDNDDKSSNGFCFKGAATTVDDDHDDEIYQSPNISSLSYAMYHSRPVETIGSIYCWSFIRISRWIL